MIHPLESRISLSASPLESILADGYNAARANPTAACDAVHVGLNDGLPDGLISPAPKRAIKWSDKLAKPAREYAQKLLERGEITHNLDGTSPESRANADGWYSTVILENAGVSCTDQTLWNLPAVLTRQVNQYIAHAGHRAQMFDERTSNVGVGIASGYWQGRAAVVSVVMMASEPMRVLARPVFSKFPLTDD